MIRAALPVDVGRIAALVRASFDSRLHEFMVYAQHGIDRFIRVNVAMPLAGPRRHFLVDAGADGHVCAFAEFHEGTGDSPAFLSYICVAPETRGQGIATALIDHFLSVADPVALALDVFAENSAALAMYDKLGFAPTGSTGWFVRNLPPAAADALSLIDAAEAVSMHAQYGFCRHGVEWCGAVTALGRIGLRTLRCFTPDDFGDDRLLGAARTLFPEAGRALFICPTDAPGTPSENLLFNSSLRMTLSLRKT